MAGDAVGVIGLVKPSHSFGFLLTLIVPDLLIRSFFISIWLSSFDLWEAKGEDDSDERVTVSTLHCRRKLILGSKVCPSFLDFLYLFLVVGRRVCRYGTVVS